LDGVQKVKKRKKIFEKEKKDFEKVGRRRLICFRVDVSHYFSASYVMEFYFILKNWLTHFRHLFSDKSLVKYNVVEI